jgi:hypothetical protein
MAASATSTGDDLIIISDETPEHVEAPQKTEISSWELQVIEEKASENTLSFELTWSTQPSVSEPVQAGDTGFSLSNTQEAAPLMVTQEVVSQPVEAPPAINSTWWDIGNDENMDDILQETIGKLKLRQENISRIKETKNADIDLHNGKIKMLQDKVSSLKSEVDGLDVENTKIQANISSLESMKAPLTDDGGGVSIDVKAYNQKRVVKTANV